METRFVRALIVSFCVAAAAASAAEKKPGKPAPEGKAGKVPDLYLSPRQPLTEERKKEIRLWIESLAEVDGPGFGYSGTLSGSVFAPQPETAKADTMMLTDHQLKASEALTKLVEAGPDALPFLLEKLNDATPARYTAKCLDGRMWFDREMSVNPTNPDERASIPKFLTGQNTGESIREYTLKRGDLCFVIIGQITGRSYQAMRYQPSGCTVINSPVECQEMREAVRANWQSPDARAKLFHSLLFDYSTQGVYNGKDLSGWRTFRIAAALRLAFYFPEETADLLAQYVDSLNVDAIPDPNNNLKGWCRREVANGARTQDLLQALGGTKPPQIQSALLRAAHRTNDPYLFIELLPVVRRMEPEFAEARMDRFLAALPPVEERINDCGHNLLAALVKADGEGAKERVLRYLKKGSAQRRASVCYIFRFGAPEWAAEILLPMLDDAGSFQGEDVRDEAALSLIGIREGLEYDRKGTWKERTERIKRIKAAFQQK